MMEDNYHVSVFPAEVISHCSFLTDRPGHLIDMTFGGGGHSFMLLDRYPLLKITAFDQDQYAVQRGRKKIQEKKLEQRITLFQENFANFNQHIEDTLFDAALFDLGVSSHHFNCPERGFSFRFDASLDMRMNQGQELTAFEVVNYYSRDQLEELLFLYGEEPFAKRIAEKICNSRAEKKIETTKELENIIFHAYPAKLRHRKTHPATRTFQALRIEVNNELNVLKKTLPQVLEVLSPQGLLMVISFHSLEDRIVKHQFKDFKRQGYGEILYKKPLIPAKSEQENNPRSRSAKLRVVRKR